MTYTSEDRWTQPREDCPHPEWWFSSDSDSTEWEVSRMVAGFVTGLQPDLVVETGTAFGQTAQMVGVALRNNRHGSLISYETDAKRVKFSKERCEGLPVSIRQQKSLEGIAKLKDGSVGFAWLDSLFELRAHELRAIRPKLTPNAVVGIHDTGPHHPLWEMLESELPGWRYLRLPTPRGVTFLQTLS